jgi:hypothetical protein
VLELFPKRGTTGRLFVIFRQHTSEVTARLTLL